MNDLTNTKELVEKEYKFNNELDYLYNRWKIYFAAIIVMIIFLILYLSLIYSILTR
jgi:hypothetical protein